MNNPNYDGSDMHADLANPMQTRRILLSRESVLPQCQCSPPTPSQPFAGPAQLHTPGHMLDEGFRYEIAGSLAGQARLRPMRKSARGSVIATNRTFCTLAYKDPTERSWVAAESLRSRAWLALALHARA